MNPLVKKEIRLVGPGWLMAMLLALTPFCTRSDDGIPVALLFIGMTIMALSSIGRETSLNTFSSLLAQPVERQRIWQIKLSVLSVAFLTVFILWRLATIFSFKDYGGLPADADQSDDIFIAGCMITVATFTGGLWSTLLLRQITGAFWLTLLVPMTFCGLLGAFLAKDHSSFTVNTALGLFMMLYGVIGMVAARWLFFHAQDVGWSGGNLVLPEWKWLSANSEDATSARNHRPLLALIKKELRLQQVCFFGTAGLFILHLGIIIWRAHHRFARNSDGEMLTSIFFMLWFILPVLVGSVAIAEERKLGVMESQSCLPVSRRRQFIIKGMVVFFLGIIFGGVMPVALESLGRQFGSPNTELSSSDLPFLIAAVTAFSFWLTLISFFASSLARNFLQAIGYAMATVIVLSLVCGVFLSEPGWLFPSIPPHSPLPLLIGVPVATITLLFLALLNFKSLQQDWRLWKKNLLIAGGMIVLILVAVPAMYHRAWEVLEPAEPAHGPATLTQANPPVLHNEWGGLQVRLPDGRVWFSHLDWNHRGLLGTFLYYFDNGLPQNYQTGYFVAGSNWVSVAGEHVDFDLSRRLANGPALPDWVTGYLNTIGIRSDGTLWLSAESKNGAWTGDRMTQYGQDSNWRQVVYRSECAVLLKNDGTLWRWRINGPDWSHWRQTWPDLRSYPMQQTRDDSHWQEIISYDLLKKSDGTVWNYYFDDKDGSLKVQPLTALDSVPLQTLSRSGQGDRAYVRPDGTLWVSRIFNWAAKGDSTYSDFAQVGTGTNWTAAAINWHGLIALRSDGTLWRWNLRGIYDNEAKSDWLADIQVPPSRVGIHSDWVALSDNWGATVTLAADGSLWYWPERDFYGSGGLLQMPKQPRYLGNVFKASN